jgi:FlaA1/EpsC-like NDP-sugar epimerase
LWVIALALAVELRFEGFPEPYASRLVDAVMVLVACRIITFYMHGLFHGLWRYAGLPELKSLIRATTLASLGFVGVGAMLRGVQMPRSIYVGEWLASIVFVGGARFAIRMLRERKRPTSPLAVPTLIVGAGDMGESLLRDVQRQVESRWEIVGFLDDNRRKLGALVREVRVLGLADEATLRRVVEQHNVRLVVLAIPTVAGERIRELLSVCRSLGVQTKTVPSLSHRMTEVAFAALRELSIDDLLRREPVHLDLEQVAHFLAARTVIVTGAGGSIGSELSRQVLWFRPKQLILFDHDENALFHIERELLPHVQGTQLVVAMGDITDRERVEQVFLRYRPHVVLHAAAHKHVPLMERNACEAVKNNVFGTLVVADAAHAAGAAAFVMISTDKAVNPTSVMGATKRVAEMAVQSRNNASQTRHVVVRFGNVLGSAGSVVPLFREQIARGGPVTITHPEMRRYFMTIPEAAQLVLQAGALAAGGEIFVLDMGDPVKIVDLAYDLIELSGMRPDADIQIEFTGLRPGEKLFEELLFSGEAFDKTPHPKILVGRIQSPAPELIKTSLVALRHSANAGDDVATRHGLLALVPEANLAISEPGKVPSSVPALDDTALAHST